MHLFIVYSSKTLYVIHQEAKDKVHFQWKCPVLPYAEGAQRIHPSS